MGTQGLGDEECSGLRQNSPYTLQEVTDKPRSHQGGKGIHCRDRTKHLSSQVMTMPDHQPPHYKINAHVLSSMCVRPSMVSLGP